MSRDFYSAAKTFDAGERTRRPLSKRTDDTVHWTREAAVAAHQRRVFR